MTALEAVLAWRGVCVAALVATACSDSQAAEHASGPGGTGNLAGVGAAAMSAGDTSRSGAGAVNGGAGGAQSSSGAGGAGASAVAGSGEAGTGGSAGSTAPGPPNIVVILFDDVGYGDFAAFGGQGVLTPELDQMAREGMRFTSFYVQPLCTASRTALLTGSYPQRVSMPGVLGPDAKTGLNLHETTIAEALKTRGYATAIFGKWHLGRPVELLPTAQGFDEYFGEPYSNDMAPHVMLEGTAVVESDPSDDELTQRYTERALSFIERKRDTPFFLYFAPNMAHMPIGATAKFRGTTPRGLYSDAIAELDWSVGQIRAKLKQLDLDSSTLVVVTSDNGPYLKGGARGGSPGSLRQGKFTTFEGGMRTPMIAAWPGTIPADSMTGEPVSEIDLLPTIANAVGAELAPSRKIDGKDIMPLLRGEAGAKSPHDALYFYAAGELQAVRSGKWKLHFPHDYERVEMGENGPVSTEASIGLALFDLEQDMGEAHNVASDHPDVVEKLQGLANLIRPELGDTLTMTKGSGVRPIGTAP